MNQEDSPQFSHITVGKTGVSERFLPDEEEIVPIGAVGLSFEETPEELDIGRSEEALSDSSYPEITAIGAVSLSHEETPEEVDIGRSEEALSDSLSSGQGFSDNRELYDLQADETDSMKAEETDDELFGMPMSFPQKVVLAACAIGVVITVAYLVWHWFF